MKMIFFVPVLLVLFSCALLSCNQQQEATEQAVETNEELYEDEMEDVAELITELYGINQMILEVAQIAQGNSAVSQDLLEMNETILNDHQQVKDRLTQLASQKNIALPENITYEEGSEIYNLREADPDDFLDEYINTLSQATDDMESKLENINEQLEGGADDIANFVQQTITTVRAHEELTDEVDETI